MKSRASNAGCLSLLALSFAMAGCATPQPRPVETYESFECGFVWKRAGVVDAHADKGVAGDLTIFPLEITPGNRNGINDHAEISVDFATAAGRDSIPVSARFEFRSARTCELMRSIEVPVTHGGAGVRWDGTDSRGRTLRPGHVAVTATVEYADGGTTETPPFGLLISADACLDRTPQDRPLVSLDSSGDFRKAYRRVTLDEAATVCVGVTRAADGVGRDAALRIGGRTLIDGFPLGDRVVAAASLSAGTHNVLLDPGMSGATFEVWQPAFPDPPPAGTPFDAQTCEGRLRGFAHPFGLRGREPVERGGVVVDCVFEAEVWWTCSTAGCKPRKETIPVRARGRTNADGSFSVTIPESRIGEARLFRESANAIELRTECHPLECGYEAVGSIFSLQNFSDLGDGRNDIAPGMDVNDVLDIVMFSGTQGDIPDYLLAVETDLASGAGVPGEPKESARALLGARLVSNGEGAERNDLPFVVHEQIDTLHVEASRFMIWGMSGQPIKGDVPKNGCDSDYARCIFFDEMCNPGLCGNGDVHCLAEPLLPRLLEEGYDVWLVDHLQGRRDIVELASAAPALYEAISRYPVPKPVAIGVPARDPAPPRRLAVSGISLGSVVARVALKLWEERESLPDISGVRSSDLAVPTASVEDRVALYLSIDGPHRGARLPLSLQAYIQNLPPVTSEAEALKVRLNATPTRQFLREWIPPVDTDCFVVDDRFQPADDVKSCSYDRADLVPFVDSQAHADLQLRTVNQLDAPQRDPLERRPDGLPDIVPSIAVSNGRFPPTPVPVGTDTVLRLKFDATLWPDPVNQRLFDSGLADDTGQPLRRFHQPGGSGFDGVCRAEIEGSSTSSTKLGAVHGGIAGAVVGGGLFGGGGTGFIVAGSFVALGALIGTPVDATVWIPMAPGSDDGGKGFPTLVTTESSLLQIPGQREPTAVWRDFIAPVEDGDHRRHTDFRDDQCKFVMYHLNGHMKGDRDGVPSCDSFEPSADCADGGMSPGLRLDPQRRASLAPDDFCDCSDELGHVSPFAAGINRCELRIRNRLSIPE